MSPAAPTSRAAVTADSALLPGDQLGIGRQAALSRETQVQTDPAPLLPAKDSFSCQDGGRGWLLPSTSRPFLTFSLCRTPSLGFPTEWHQWQLNPGPIPRASHCSQGSRVQAAAETSASEGVSQRPVGTAMDIQLPWRRAFRVLSVTRS